MPVHITCHYIQTALKSPGAPNPIISHIELHHPQLFPLMSTLRDLSSTEMLLTSKVHCQNCCCNTYEIRVIT